ncbi:MAG: hypothetical protein VX228_14210, partial [Pseudomonadota bacterium]|nr:hypothetical protein [Pseudomonadota bacterium]
RELDKSIEIKFNNNNDHIELDCDPEQLSRVFFNLIKNSIESIHQKAEKSPPIWRAFLCGVVRSGRFRKPANQRRLRRLSRLARSEYWAQSEKR